jgi:hypothetical protein
MVWNAKNDVQVGIMKNLNKQAEDYLRLAEEARRHCLYQLERILLVEAAQAHATALGLYALNVRNGARWDFKDEIGLQLGPGITLCSSGGCYNDIEYSVPGNIFFSYIGRAVGFPWFEIKWGAAWAERNDPAHDINSEEYVEPYNGEEDYSSADPREWNFGDERRDNEAVTLGITLWDNYGVSMTLSQFQSDLEGHIGKLQRHAPSSKPVDMRISQNWPYPVGYFNNIGGVYKPSQP